jgi:predicted dinucleotide-binding enzyme
LDHDLADRPFDPATDLGAVVGQEAAKPAVLQPARDIGFDAVDAGKLEQARLLEPWAMPWISLAFWGAVGREFGFALLRRGQPNPTA